MYFIHFLTNAPFSACSVMTNIPADNPEPALPARPPTPRPASPILVLNSTDLLNFSETQFEVRFYRVA